MNIKINPEYAKIPPKLTDRESDSLKESIKNIGQLDPIITNQKGNHYSWT